ncbi:Bax inhibitor 1 [Geranomyces michiganensis]|nr:Bax inhibitor 1 [Geranomyces michiganensis]
MSSSFFSSFASSAPQPNPSWASFKAPLAPSVRAHVTNVYLNLARMLTLSAAAAYADWAGWLSIGGGWTAAACLGCLLVFSFTSPTPQNHGLRQGLLYGFAVLKGFSLGPLISSAMYFNPFIVPKALFGTALIFGCFSLAVLTAPESSRRDIIYTRSLLAAATALMMTMSLVNIFARSAAVFNVELYLGLMMFAAYVVYDTQLMVAKAEMGSADYLAHSLELYVDLIGMFVRLVIILQKRQRESEERQRRKNERRR